MNKFTQRSRDWRTVSPLYQKMLMLLLLMVVSVSGAWAAEYTTSVNLSFLNNSFAGNGEKQWTNNEGLQNAKISWSNIANETMEVSGNRYYKFTDDNAYIKIAPYYSGVSAVFMPGDIVTVRMSTTANDVDGGFCIKSSGNAADGWQRISPNVDYAKSYTLKAEDINDDGSITIYRLAWGSNLKYYSFEVKSYRYTVNIDLSKFSTGLPSGCDAWFTINDGATQYRTEQTVSAGTKVTYTMSSTNPDYTPAGWRTSPWADPDLGWMGWSSSFTTTIRNQAVENPANNTESLYGNINAAPEFTYKPAFVVTADYSPTIPANAKGWGLTPVKVKVNGADVDASEYTLSYEVVSGHITLSGNAANVEDGFNEEETAKVKVTATPTNASEYAAGSVTYDVKILRVAKPIITVTPTTVRIGEAVTLGVTRDYNFTNPHYDWTLSDNAKTSLYGYTDPISETQAAGADNPTHTFVAKAPTSTPISVNLKFYSENGYYNNSNEYRKYEEANNTFTVKPVAVPTVYEDIDGVHFTYESDYKGVNDGDVDAFLEYFVGEPKSDNSNRVQVGFGKQESKHTATNIPQGTRIYVKSVIHYKDADNKDHYEASEPIQFVTDDAAEFPELALMMQPRYKNGIAKRYIPFGAINEIGDKNVSTSLTSQWPEDVTYGKGAITNNTMGYFLGGNAYPVEREGRGICISRNGKAHWAWTGPESDSKRQWLPKSAAFVMDVAGTLDVVLYAENTFNNYQNSGEMSDRRYINAWYLNDQCKDGKPILLKSWGILGKRYEGNYANGGNGNELRLHIRLPQLGTDGKATLLFTYEGDAEKNGNDVNDTDHDLWIRGFLIQRPDLRVSIGRTDKLYQDDEPLTNICVKEENTPYIWSFEPQTKKRIDDTNIHDDGKDAVGFRPTVDTGSKKLNKYDGRTYICGEQCDHLLVYCDNEDEPGNVDLEARPEFDGRVGDGRTAHLELVRPTDMAGNNGNDDQFNPIKSNGIKVNVTGSGWFKIKAAAPNCPVKMKVLTSTNGGVSTIRVLKEFYLPQTSEMGWNEYTAYLKAQLADNKTYDEDDAEGDPEKKYMSLYVVFESAEGVDLDTDGKVKDTNEYPQLNINQLSWLNELPADYVFQREENPKLLTEWRKIKRDDATVLYWKTGNDNDANYPVLKENGKATYDRNDQYTTSIVEGKGVKSPGNWSSVSVPSSAGTYDAYWDISAKPSTNSHTELAYANKNTVIGKESPEYANKSDRGNTEFDLPISGSFIRICAMKNTYVIAHVLPCEVNDSDPNANADGRNGTTEGEVYVLDETGSPIPYKANGADLDDDAKRFGYISYMQNSSNGTANGYKSNGGTMRIDFAANAGKEYFICAKNASISLARLEVQDWRYKPTKSTTVLDLKDNANNNSTTITNAYNTKEFYRDAKLTNRTFAANKWASLVLPFSLNEKKFEEIFGEGAQCLHFTEVDQDAKKVYLTHHYYNMIVAGRPVFVRPTKEVANPAFDDITLQASAVRNTTSPKGFEFFASYDNTEINKYDLYMNNDNAIKYQPKDGVNYPGMRSFIKSPNGFDPTKDDAGSTTPSASAKAMFLNFDDADASTATGIEELIFEEFGDNVIVVTKSTKVYDLKGRMVAEGADVNNLPAGIYVTNGKKFVVK